MGAGVMYEWLGFKLNWVPLMERRRRGKPEGVRLIMIRSAEESTLKGVMQREK
jgi:hypothetical protein